MIKEPRITLFDLSVCLSDAMDLVCPAIVSHHKQVSYIAAIIGAEMGLDGERQKDLVLAGALHDIGALSLRERLETLEFETNETSCHAEVGYELLKLFNPLCRVGVLVRNHHRYWNDGEGARSEGGEVFEESHILHLADRVAVLIMREAEVLAQARGIVDRIAGQSGRMFKPEVVEAFRAVADREYFWLDAVSPTVYRFLRQKARLKTLVLSLGQLQELALFFSRIIDFRSRFTATHSCGVASSAEALARLTGFSARECDIMRIAGHLHDLGKLAVPKEILEKPAKLEKEEFDIIRSHTYHTYRILDTLDDFDTINTWGSFHHERLNGKGYPFHHTADVMSLGSRIMCVADVFTAITEDRPYRSGMGSVEALAVLTSMVKNRALDKDIVDTLRENYDIVNEKRNLAQQESRRRYREIMEAGNE